MHIKHRSTMYLSYAVTEIDGC